MVCAELAPLAKAGGLADAVAGLSAALGRNGHDVRVLLPSYRQAPRAPRVADTITHKPSGSRYVELGLDAGPLRVYVLDAPQLFGDGRIYMGDERDFARFMALNEAAVHFSAALDWTPDIVHCHDWHAGLVPALLRARNLSGAARSILTLHNIGYQGTFAASLLEERHRAELAPWIDASADPPLINFLRTGVQTADLLSTVSPTYAREIQGSDYGMGLEDVLHARRDELVGILNGVDYAIWDPRVDPHVAVHYDRNDSGGKRDVKQALSAELGLTFGASRPLIGAVTRLVPQKGIDLLAALLPSLLETTDAAFAVLGTGDPDLERVLAETAARSPARVSVTCRYDEPLAHRILAGSDILLVPSRYEPCGLTQMYALRFGTIPVVRATGGLADTIEHFNPAQGTGNGSVFQHANVQGLAWGIGQALAWFADEAVWATLMRNAMAADFSWQRRVRQYVALYERVLRSR
jgi:starch synthase